jgi:hypothetical protein
MVVLYVSAPETRPATSNPVERTAANSPVVTTGSQVLFPLAPGCRARHRAESGVGTHAAGSWSTSQA